jgi:hypothetical protein
MIIDRYTKGVLSIIAAALVILVAQNAIRLARALGDHVQKVAICDETGYSCADVAFVKYSGTSIPRVPPRPLSGLQVVREESQVR